MVMAMGEGQVPTDGDRSATSRGDIALAQPSQSCPRQKNEPLDWRLGRKKQAEAGLAVQGVGRSAVVLCRLGTNLDCLAEGIV